VAGYEPLSRDELLSLLAERDARVARLEAENAELVRRVARLERLLSRNSGNSSMPPSGDDLPGRKLPQARPRRGAGTRKPGKQPGAPGSHLAWSLDPDETVPHFPQGACGCGAALAVGADLGVAASHQQVEIPLETAKVIQHDVHEVACRCGRVHRAAAPAGTGAPGTVTYGVNLQAWCVYLVFSGGRALRRRSGPRVCAAQRLIVECYRSLQVWCKDDAPRVSGVVSRC